MDSLLPAADRRLVLLLGLVALGLAAGTALGALGGVAHVSDEVAYTLQARLFAGGMRVGPPPDNASMLLYPFWEAGPDGSYAIFPPGWPLLLAVGLRLGAPWLINAAAAALLPGLAFALARAWERPLAEARVAAMVAALSPGVVMLAGSRMAHTTVLVALLGALVVVARGRTAPAAAWVLGGVGLAYVVLARPFDAALLGGPLIVAGLLRGRSQARLAWVLLPGLAAAGLLLDNLRLTGSALTFPVAPWWDAWVAGAGRPPGCNALGFGADIGCHPTLGSWGHSPAKAASMAVEALVLVDRHLLGVPGGLLVAALGAWRLRRVEPLLVLLLVVVGYGLYWSPGNVYGARFHHPLYAVLPVLVGAAAGALPARLVGWLPALVVGVAAASGLGRGALELSRDYWCVSDRPTRILAAADVTEGVVFVHGVGQRPGGPWDYVGSPPLTCDPLLAFGSVFQHTDPTGADGGLRVRHGLPAPDQTAAYLRLHAPEAAAWRIDHHVGLERWRLQPIRPAAPGD